MRGPRVEKGQELLTLSLGAKTTESNLGFVPVLTESNLILLSEMQEPGVVSLMNALLNSRGCMTQS